jgi:(p)ppGpp synthase/HD superfamily hydrolase
MEDIYKKFGKEVGFLVDSVTKTSLYFYNQRKKISNKIDKYLEGGIKDVRVLLLKLADREHNLSDFKNLPSHKQIRMAFETQALFEPLKKILSYDNPISIKQTKKNLAEFLRKNKINNHKKLEEYCYRETFENFTPKVFEKIYSSFGKVVWEISDFKKFKSMCRNKKFKKSINIIYLYSDGKNFKGLFYFKSGFIIKDVHKLSLSWLKK